MKFLNDKIRFFFFLLVLYAMVDGQSEEKEREKLIELPQPWLTGPLIAPVGTAVAYGDFLIKSYLDLITDIGVYDSSWHAVSLEDNFYRLRAQVFCFFGLTPWCDFNLIPQVLYQTQSDEHAVYVGDLTTGLDFQLLSSEFTPYFPGIKLAVREVFPTGRFQSLSPKKFQTDLTGKGTFATQFDLVFYKIWHLSSLHWLSATFSGEYTIHTPVEVHGFHAYGGGFGTKGTVLPGDRLQAIASFELTLNQNWVVSLDTVYTHTKKTAFLGLPGIDFSGRLAKVGQPSSEQFSFAPALEYNWSRHFGIIAGCWFSAWGRNSTEFRAGIVNFAYLY